MTKRRGGEITKKRISEHLGKTCLACQNRATWETRSNQGEMAYSCGSSSCLRRAEKSVK